MEQMTAAGGPQATVDPSLEATVRRFNDAFNRRDAREVASFWTDDGTLLNPIGHFGEGREGVERVFRDDAETVLRGATARFSVVRVRPLGEGALVDLDLEVQGGLAPRMHVVVLARRQGEAWRWVDVRPYVLASRPPQLH